MSPWTEFHTRDEQTFALGDVITIRMRMHYYRVSGVLMEIHPDYIVLDGKGFPVEDILGVEAGSLQA